MIRQNMGRLDRVLRFSAGVVLILVGLLALHGWQGEVIGLAVVAFALIPLATSLTGICPAYIPFGISTIPRKRNRIRSTVQSMAWRHE